jgi:4-hydroxy-2-oxoheptanedioate aldolase
VTYGGADYAQHANDEIFVFVMIESKEAVDNLDAILEVDGIDGTFIGPNDLGLSYGGGTGCEPPGELADVIETIRAKTAARGLVPGIFCSDGDMSARRIAQGFRFVSVGSDTTLLKSGMETQLRKIRGGVASVSKTGY